MTNPFVNGTITIYDEKLNEEVTIDILNISKYFKHIYCLGPMNSKNIDTTVFINKIIDRVLLNETINKMILYQVNISIIKNIVHYGNICYCPKDIIIGANKFGYELDDKEEILILPIYNISFLDLQKYIDNINGLITFNNLYDILIINNYFGDNIHTELSKLKVSNYDDFSY